MALTVLAGLLVTGFAAGYFGGSSAVTFAACVALAIGSIISFGPALFRVESDHWGVAVLACGVVRGMGVLAAAYFMAQNDPALTPRPLYMGAAAGAVVILIAESVIAVTILSRLERQREQIKSAKAAFIAPLAD
jgi:hypothetical protein